MAPSQEHRGDECQGQNRRNDLPSGDAPDFPEVIPRRTYEQVGRQQDHWYHDQKDGDPSACDSGGARIRFQAFVFEVLRVFNI